VEKFKRDPAVHKLASKEMHDNYARCLEQELVDWSPTNECSAEECWNQLQSGIISSTEQCIGRGYRSNSEWFEDNADTLKPLIDIKNEALQKYLQRDTRSRKRFFHQCQQAVQKAVNKAKEEWIKKVASDAEAAVKDGKLRWKTSTGCNKYMVVVDLYEQLQFSRTMVS